MARPSASLLRLSFPRSFLFLLQQHEIDAVQQRLVTRFDQVLAYADCSPRAFTITALDQNAHACCRAAASIQYPHLEINKMRPLQDRVVLNQCLT